MMRPSPDLKSQNSLPYLQSQAGMALIFALLVLAALMLASVALVRVMNNSSYIAGNLAFQQDALMVSERATQLAIDTLFQALSSNLEALNQSTPALGFYASAPANLDPTGHALEGDNTRALIQWDNNYCNTFATTSYGSCMYTPNRNAIAVNGNSASYIVFRLCSSAGALSDADVHCTTDGSASSSSALSGKECQGAINYANLGNCPQQILEGAQLYRIVVRTVGPRNTVSFTETLVYI